MLRLRALDGLRALSILLVIADHLLRNHLLPTDGPWWRFDLGRVGVRVFFVISGFLITGLLLREQARTAEIRLGRFYFRRLLRIAPPALVYLAAIGAMSAFGLSAATPRDLVHAATYTSNYVSMPWDLGHTWSLSVEEQFYLFWPLVLGFWGTRGGVTVACIWLITGPIIRAIAGAAESWPYPYVYGFEANADALAAGCMLALLRDRAWKWPRWRTFIEGRLFWLATFGLFLLWPLTALSPLREVVGVSVVNVVVALVVERCLRLPDEPVTRILDNRFLVTIGVLSYALYLCQQPFLAASRDLPLAVRIGGFIIAALLLHYLVERPALRWRTRLEARFFRRSSAEVAVPPQPLHEP